ncbi:cytochrome c [bacterium]|nr:cytochrome c [bacterium]
MFAEHCAMCHGHDAKGGGDVAGLTVEKTPDLTKIVERRGGAFPFMEIFAIVRGYAGDGPHDRRTMPFTGKVFAYGADGDPNSVMARARQLELTYYLSEIQR